MRIEKRVLNDALRVLGKVVSQTSPVELHRSVRFVGNGDGICAMATDGVETVSVILDTFTETEIDFCVPFKELKDLVRMGRSETIDLSGKFIEFPELEEPSADAVSAILPVNFGELLAQAASVVDRSNYRRLLQGINLSNAGVTATDGKQLLHLPCVLSLAKDVTIPFPSALLAAKTSEMGTLQVWDNRFQIKIGNFKWYGKLLEGQYPNWRGVIPSAESHDYTITLNEPGRVLDWVKMIPSQKTTNGVELNVISDSSVTLVSCTHPDFKLNTQATVTGVRPRAVLTLDREIILRMLLQNYTPSKPIRMVRFRCLPVVVPVNISLCPFVQLKLIPYPTRRKKLWKTFKLSDLSRCRWSPLPCPKLKSIRWRIWVTALKLLSSS